MGGFVLFLWSMGFLLLLLLLHHQYQQQLLLLQPNNEDHQWFDTTNVESSMSWLLLRSNSTTTSNIQQPHTHYNDNNDDTLFFRSTPNEGPVILIEHVAHVQFLICGGGRRRKKQRTTFGGTNHHDATNNNNGGHVVFRTACTADSTGNWLGYIFWATLYAFQQNCTFQLDCHNDDQEEAATVQSLLSQPPYHIWYYNINNNNIMTPAPALTNDSIPSQPLLPPMDFCQTMPQNQYPHQHRYGLQYAAPWIRTVLRRAFPLHPNNTTTANDTRTITDSDDDVAIHIRCGDVLKYAHHSEYGYPRYEFYRQTIHRHFHRDDHVPHPTLSITIVTAPLDPSHCRVDKDCDWIPQCRAILTDLVQYLETSLSVPAVVRIDRADTTVRSYARLLHAKLNICNPSTFCVYPAMAAFGESYIVASEQLYPFITDLPHMYRNIHVAHVEFLNMTQIHEWQEAGQDLVTAITSWARTTTTTTTTTTMPTMTTTTTSWMEEPSRIEMIQDEFMVLTNVCLTNDGVESSPYVLHFFDRPLVTIKPSATISTSLGEESKEDIVRLFRDHFVPYTAWESDLTTSPPFEGIPTALLQNQTMRQFLTNRNGHVSIQNTDGIVLVNVVFPNDNRRSCLRRPNVDGILPSNRL